MPEVVRPGSRARRHPAQPHSRKSGSSAPDGPTPLVPWVTSRRSDVVKRIWRTRRTRGSDDAVRLLGHLRWSPRFGWGLAGACDGPTRACRGYAAGGWNRTSERRTCATRIRASFSSTTSGHRERWSSHRHMRSATGRAGGSETALRCSRTGQRCRQRVSRRS